MSLPYWVVDAFTDTMFTGNPAAVVLPDQPLDDALMAQIAKENNLSETAFAVPEGDGWRLRWFTPTVEVDLCGHATLATTFVLAGQGHQGPFHFHTRSGLLTARVEGHEIELDFPARAFALVPEPPDLSEALGLAPQEVVRASDFIAVLSSAAEVAAVRPNFAAIAALPGGSLVITAPGGDGVDITSRYFAPGKGIDEDPVTGGMHTQIVPYWAQRLGKTELLCRQASARGGTMRCVLNGDRVRMTGTAVLYARGEVFV